MRVSELIRKLEPFAKCAENEHEEPVVLIATQGNIMPTAPDKVKIWEINGIACLLIFKDPN
jgi:hypothetical protein